MAQISTDTFYSFILDSSYHAVKYERVTSAFNPDSFNIFYYPDKKMDLITTQQDSAEICKILIGKWENHNITLPSGAIYQADTRKEIWVFQKHHKCYVQTSKSKYCGRWYLSNKFKGEIQIIYNKPRLRIEDEKVLKLLDKKQIEQFLSYTNETLTIHHVSSSELSFASTRSTSEPNFSRWVFINYKRVKE